jgi:hypothetical protein
MYFCYIDESGTPDVPGNTSHYILAGVSIPEHRWKTCDEDVERIKAKYGLADEEIHVAWILRSYPEQRKIPNFDTLTYGQRRQQVNAFRTSELLRLQRVKNKKQYSQTKKNYKSTEKYIHLTSDERRRLIQETAQLLSGWGFARLFAECIDKIHFDPSRAVKSIDEQAFEQVVSRFEYFLQGVGKAEKSFGLLIHDNNETVAKRHTLLMKKFHKEGTLWTNLKNIIETPLFVNSELTSMVQMADLCGYALRRYLENKEEDLFKLIFKRADRRGDSVVGVRHFTNGSCACCICSAHRKAKTSPCNGVG